MNPWVRMGRIAAIGALAVGPAAAGIYVQGRILGVVGLLVGGSLAFAVLFLTAPTCDECGSPRVNRINDSPLKCGRCGHIHGGKTRNVVLTDPTVRAGNRVERPDGSRWVKTLRAFAFGVFGVGVAVVVYAVMGLTVPTAFDPETWSAANTWRLLTAIFGLGMNTVGLMIYIISYRLS
jgi:hypothetical protein